MPVQKPRARSDDLVIEEVDDELLVYDSTNKRGPLPERDRGTRVARLRWPQRRERALRSARAGRGGGQPGAGRAGSARAARHPRAEGGSGGGTAPGTGTGSPADSWPEGRRGSAPGSPRPRWSTRSTYPLRPAAVDADEPSRARSSPRSAAALRSERAPSRLLLLLPRRRQLQDRRGDGHSATSETCPHGGAAWLLRVLRAHATARRRPDEAAAAAVPSTGAGAVVDARFQTEWVNLLQLTGAVNRPAYLRRRQLRRGRGDLRPRLLRPVTTCTTTVRIVDVP